MKSFIYLCTQHILLTVIYTNIEKEGKVLFNDALNTFYLQLYIKNIEKERWKSVI